MSNPLREAWFVNALCLFVVMMHDNKCRHDACMMQFMHHADPTGLIHSQRVGMMHQCSAGELLTSAVLLHHDSK